MNIGEAAEASGVSAKMIRYYESAGLIGAAARSEAGYRVYSDEEVHSLRFVRAARDLGFTVRQIGELLALWRDRSRASSQVKRMALQHIKVLETKIHELNQMVKTLTHLADNCSGDQRPHCPIVETLAHHGSTAVSPGRGRPFGKATADRRRRGDEPQRSRP